MKQLNTRKKIMDEKEKKGCYAPTVVLTEGEIQKILPSFKKEMLLSTKKEVQDILTKFFWDIGIDYKRGFEIEEQQVITKNRLGELDSSARIYFKERTDKVWLNSGYASELAKEVSSDPTLSRVLFKMKNGGE